MRDCVWSEFRLWFFNYIFRIYIEGKKKKKKLFFDIPTVICIVFIEDFPLFCFFG